MAIDWSRRFGFLQGLSCSCSASGRASAPSSSCGCTRSPPSPSPSGPPSSCGRCRRDPEGVVGTRGEAGERRGVSPSPVIVSLEIKGASALLWFVCLERQSAASAASSRARGASSVPVGCGFKILNLNLKMKKI